MDKLRMIYKGKTLKNEGDIQELKNILDNERRKARRIREIELLGYSYYLLDQLKRTLNIDSN